MGWGAIIASVLKIILIGLGALMERNKYLKEAKKEALKEAGNGWKNGDVGRIHAAWERSNRLR